ncbi:MAG: elongation factor G [Candidatus Sumerlaeia bacterium]
MKEYTAENVRNVIFMGHSGTGKSTLGEAMLFANKNIERMGKTEDGNLTSDYDPEEVKRQMSINASLLPVETKTIKVNVLDCPGSRDFVGEILGCAHVAEGGIIFVDATSGIQVGTELAYEWADDMELPAAVFINKLDKENAKFQETLDALTETFGKNAVALTLPIGLEADLKGVADIIAGKAYDESDGKTTNMDMPADVKEQAEALRESIIEAAAEGDEALMEKYFEEGTLSDEEVATGLKKAFMERTFIPVFCGAASQGIGVKPLMDFLANSFPTPLEDAGLKLKGEEDKMQKVDPDGPFSAFVFRTVSDDFAGRLTFFKVMTGQMTAAMPLHNNTKDAGEKVSHILTVVGKKQEEVAHINAGDIGVVAKLTSTSTNDTLADPKNKIEYEPTHYPQRSSKKAVRAKSSQDEDKIGVGMHSLMEQDPTLHFERDPETQQSVLSGMGEQHIDIAISRLKAKTKVEVDLEQPRIRYRETVTKLADGKYRHKKQSGGRGQFAEVFMRVSPSEEEDYEFKWSVFGGAIPTNFQSAVDKGAQQAMEKGILAGNRVVGVLVDCYDGKHHPVDSSDMAFQIASSMCFRQTALEAGPIILEPIMNVVTTVPEANMGDVMGDVSQRRGKIQGQETKGKKVIVRAQIPESEMGTYAQNLRSMSGGRGSFEMEFSHYDPVPHDVQQKIIAESKQEEEE